MANQFLENIAVAFSQFPESAWRHAGGSVERANKVGQIAETNVKRDVGD
jgi:hypothetical protein